jgi:hypothetical protein
MCNVAAVFYNVWADTINLKLANYEKFNLAKGCLNFIVANG